jgi:hypothetical protein
MNNKLKSSDIESKEIGDFAERIRKPEIHVYA